jgi:hypothetical protein
MTGIRRWYAVDRVEGDRVVLIGDDDPRPVELPAASLPFPLREAMVLAVPLDAHGCPQWGRAERDEAEERRRLDEGRARIERLRLRDPGGDISI